MKRYARVFLTHQEAKRAYRSRLDDLRGMNIEFKATTHRLKYETDSYEETFLSGEQPDRLRGLVFDNVWVDERLGSVFPFGRYMTKETPCDHQYVDHPSLPQENCRVCGKTKEDFATTDLRSHLKTEASDCKTCKKHLWCCEHGFCDQCKCKHYCWLD